MHCMFPERLLVSLLRQHPGTIPLSKPTAVAANGILIREGLWVDAGDELQRIFVIDFLEYFVWELEAINSPESVTLAVVLEVFVASFQSAEIPFVFIHIVDVFTHQHAILIFH